MKINIFQKKNNFKFFKSYNSFSQKPPKQSAAVKLRREVERTRDSDDNNLPYPMNKMSTGSRVMGTESNQSNRYTGETSSSAYGGGIVTKKTHMRNNSFNGDYAQRDYDRDQAFGGDSNKNNNNYALKMRNKNTDLW